MIWLCVVRPLNVRSKSSEFRLTVLRAVNVRSPLAKVDIEKGWAPGGKNGVIRGIESGTLVRSACVGYALSFKRVENRADGNAGRLCPDDLW